MKKLLNTLYVTTPEVYLALEGETVVVLKGEETLARLPLLNLESIVTCGYAGASPALMGACARRGVSLCFLTASGRFLARVTGESRGNVTLRKEQYRASDSEEKSCRIARSFVVGKIYNSKWVLECATRDHALRVDVDAIKAVSSHLTEHQAREAGCESLEALRGIEGKAAAAYFSQLDGLILQQRESFTFSGRSRRPPEDNMNALLSFFYTILANGCASALEAVGLDAYVGFLHRERPGRASLALDLMEELRSVAVDRFVLSLINRRIVTDKGFEKRESGAVAMSDGTKKAALNAWQERKREGITHPFLEEKLEWSLVPYAQALLLARHLRGDLDAYPPFFWK